MLLEQGLTISETARRLGVTPTTVCFMRASSESRDRINTRRVETGGDPALSTTKVTASGRVKDGQREECGVSEWLGEPLSMALHHVNGDGSDNRLENLRLLCANCHSQTP